MLECGGCGLVVTQFKDLSVFSVSCVRETAAPGLALPASSDQAALE